MQNYKKTSKSQKNHASPDAHSDFRGLKANYLHIVFLEIPVLPGKATKIYNIVTI